MKGWDLTGSYLIELAFASLKKMFRQNSAIDTI